MLNSSMVALSPSAVVLGGLLLLASVYLLGRFIMAYQKRQAQIAQTLAYFMDGENFPTPCWVKDMQGVIIFVNKAAMETIFVPAGERNPVGKTFQDIFPEEVTDLVKLLEIKAFNSMPRAKIAVISFPNAGPLYIIKSLVTDINGEPMVQGFALPFDALSAMPEL